MKKLTDNLASIAALIGVLGTITAGAIKYGEVMQRLEDISTPDLKPIEKSVARIGNKTNKNKTDIAIANKEIELLKLQLREIKASNNPMGG